MESEPVSLIITPTTDTPVAAVMAQVQALLVDVMAELQTHLLSDDDVLGSLSAMEGIGRLVDAGRVMLAADVDARSDTRTQNESLARTRGCATGTDLITMVTRVSAREAKRRVRLGAKTRITQVVGATLPPRYPVVADALTNGTIGVDAAEQIVTGLSDLPSFLAPTDVDAAERGLVASATGTVTAENEGLPNAGFAFPADLIRGQVLQWKALLDPDGTAPAEGTVMAARSTFGFGQFRDGLYPLRGGVTPELRGVMNGIFDTYLSAHSQPVPAEPGRFPTAEEQATHEAEEQARIDAGEVIPGADQLEALDPRTGGEKRADILRGVFAAAARDKNTPTMGGAAPLVMVHVNAKDLLDGTGVGWADGVEAPLSISTVQRLVCAGGMQKIVFAANGEVLQLDMTTRFFTRVQRRAILARDGGCVIPGCLSPPNWAEMHHVIPWYRGGPTNVNNGVALCWYHHHTIDTSGWLIQLVDGAVHVKAPPWMGLGGDWLPANQHRAHTALGR
ncbi:DUF222 domain-containing protein [Leifsonia sp. YAF41]|uniref:HNH endonuclease signature motif containing protein n=1 Tax=Leifsonia sp. YAF41 TaxID=3233086 RepID=UPI003F99D180